MPCTNVALVVSKLVVDEETLALASKLALDVGRVRLYASIVAGKLAAMNESEVVEARNWILALRALQTARAQGYRTEVKYESGKIVVAGVVS